MNEKKEWGFLRETKEKATAAGIDKDTGIKRTGLDEYLAVIFPDVNDWVHDKVFDDLFEGEKTRKRPDYISKRIKLIVEFDGLQHYTNPDKIILDEENTSFYEEHGYKVVRIPYFIQLTKRAVKQMFDVDMSVDLFNESIPSIGPKGQNSPAYLCGAGIVRMAKEFKLFPEQYLVNINFLKEANDEYHTGASLLETIYDSLE